MTTTTSNVCRLAPRRRTLIATAAICLAVASTALAQAGESQTPGASTRVLLESDLAPLLDNDGGESELWNFHLLLEDGVRIHVSFFRTNLGFPIGRVAGYDVSVVGLTAQPHNVVRRFKADRFRYSSTPVQRLEIHTSAAIESDAASGWHVRLATTKDGVRTGLEFAITNVVPGSIRGDGGLSLDGGGEVRVLPLIVHGAVTGRVQVGELEAELKGTVYADHMALTARPDRMLANVFQFVDHGDSPRAGLLYQTARTRRQAGLVFGADGSVMTVSKILRDSDETHLGIALPMRIDADGRILRNGPPDQRYSVLDNMSGLARLVFRAFVGGEVVILRGTGLSGADPIVYSYSTIR